MLGGGRHRPASGGSRGGERPRRLLRARSQPPRGRRWRACRRPRDWLSLARREWKSRGTVEGLSSLRFCSGGGFWLSLPFLSFLSSGGGGGKEIGCLGITHMPLGTGSGL